MANSAREYARHARPTELAEDRGTSQSIAPRGTRVDTRRGWFIEQELIFKGIGRVRDVASGPDGFLYVVLNRPDKVVRLEPVR